MTNAAADDATRRTLLAFGRALYETRSEQNITQAMLAERTGITQPAISRIENGLQAPTLTQLGLLGTALGLTAAQLVEAGTTRDRSPRP